MSFTFGIRSQISSIRPVNSGPNTIPSTSASLQQYLISSAVYLKLSGTAMAPVFRIPKYIGSHSMQFIRSIAILSPFLTPLERRRFANLLACTLNSPHVISLRNLALLVDSIREYSLHVILGLSSSPGFNSTRLTSFLKSVALCSKISVIGISDFLSDDLFKNCVYKFTVEFLCKAAYYRHDYK